MLASNDPSAELVTRSLGACLGVTVYDPVNKVGGLLHVMLPDSRIDTTKANQVPFMFVNSGVPRMFDAAYQLGADRRRIVVKAAGGSHLLDDCGVFNVGQRNYNALSDILSRSGLLLHSWDVGGNTSRTLHFDIETGRIAVKCPGSNPYFL